MDTFSDENVTGVNDDGRKTNTPLKYLTATSIIGDKVRNDKDEDMGKIEDIMVNIITGKIEYVVIEFGGFLTIGSKYFAIPFQLLKVDAQNKSFILSQSKEMLENAPGFDMSHWPETNFHAEATYWTFM